MIIGDCMGKKIALLRGKPESINVGENKKSHTDHGGRVSVKLPALIILVMMPLTGCVIEGEDLYHRVESVDEDALGTCESFVDFSTEVQPIFNDACTLCHAGDTPAGQLSLADGVAYEQLVGVASLGSDKNLIEANDDAASWLVDRILERDGATLMPQVGGKLDVDEIATIVCWINQGAHGTAEDAENAQ